MSEAQSVTPGRKIAFKAETSQILDILIHSLYTEREVFLRELISNASDALTRMSFEQLTNREVLEPNSELAIHIQVDPAANTISISDSGIGMNATELEENLGTIAHSGARAFLQAAKDTPGSLSDIIGQFGVGFYSAFMVADHIEVFSRSFRPDDAAAAWKSDGTDTYEIRETEKESRGTLVTVHLKPDAAEFANEDRLREIIRRHSDYIPYPIYVGDSVDQLNHQTALWRQPPREIKPEEYDAFYKQYTLDPQPPLAHIHIAADAPVQVYALLFMPSSPERSIFSPRQQDGLKLYARKVLIQEYNKNLLPEYLQFVEGVVDSEDLPLSVSREAIQSNRVIAQLKQLVTNKVIEMLKSLARDNAESYTRFWNTFGRAIRQGIATDMEQKDALVPLLRFHSTTHPGDLISLDDYIAVMQPSQDKIYYILGDDARSLARSPHLEQFRAQSIDVLLLTDPLDAFMLLRMDAYQEHILANAATEKLETPPTVEQSETQSEPVPTDALQTLLALIKTQLGERIGEVRASDVLRESPARMVDPQGSMTQEVQRVYRMLNKEYDAPTKDLEVNPRHPLVRSLASLPPNSDMMGLVIEQLYENALLIEGLHPDPAGMIERIQKIMQAALTAKNNG